MTEGSRSVRLRSDHRADGDSFLDVCIDDEGNLHLDGHDLGPMTSFISPDGEYEYFKTITAANLPELRRLLGIQPGDDLLEVLEAKWKDEGSYELERIMSDSALPVEFYCWP